MSIAPPGHQTPQNATHGAGSQRPDDYAQHEYKCVKAVRGREGSAKAKWQSQGWEFVSETRGGLRTELHFRRKKPKTVGAYVLGIVASVQGLRPKTRVLLIASCALVLVAGTVGMVAATQRGGNAAVPSAAQAPASTAPTAAPAAPTAEPAAPQTPAPTAAPAEPTAADGAVDELSEELDEINDELDELDSALASEDAGTAHYENCTEAREAGVAPLREGDEGYASHLDREGDGIACEN